MGKMQLPIAHSAKLHLPNFNLAIKYKKQIKSLCHSPVIGRITFVVGMSPMTVLNV